MSIAAKTTLTTTETMSNGPRRINLFYCIGTFGQMQKGKGTCPKREQKRRLRNICAGIGFYVNPSLHLNGFPSLSEGEARGRKFSSPSLRLSPLSFVGG